MDTGIVIRGYKDIKKESNGFLDLLEILDFRDDLAYK